MQTFFETDNQACIGRVTCCYSLTWFCLWMVTIHQCSGWSRGKPRSYFLRATACYMLSSVRLSVCPSVCLSHRQTKTV